MKFIPSHVSFISKSNGETTLKFVDFDEVTNKNKLAPFYGPRCTNIGLTSPTNNIVRHKINSACRRIILSLFQDLPTYQISRKSTDSLLSYSTDEQTNRQKRAETLSRQFVVWVFVGTCCVSEIHLNHVRPRYKMYDQHWNRTRTIVCAYRFLFVLRSAILHSFPNTASFFSNIARSVLKGV